MAAKIGNRVGCG